MATFRHPAVAPLVQLGANTFVLELFHGPTLAFKDLAMQLLARLMDHVLASRGERATIVVATSGDTGGAAVEAFRGRSQVDVVVLFPARPRLRRAAAHDDDADDANVHALAIEGTFDDCQAIVKAMFNHHAFRDRVRLSGVNSINWARIVAQVVYYFTAAVALGAPHRKVAFTVPTGNFGDVFAGYVATRMGLPIERLMVATNVNDILVAHARDRRLRGARRGADRLALDGHPGVVEFRAAAVRGLRPRCRGRCAALMGSLAQSRRFAIAPQALAGDPRRCSPPTAPTRRRPPRRSAPCCARPATCSIRTPRVAHRGRREGDARSGDPDGRAVDRASGEIPRRGRGRLRHAPGAAGLARRPRRRAASASPCCRPTRRRSRRFVLDVSRAAHEGAAA